jgi:hypothetical protein
MTRTAPALLVASLATLILGGCAVSRHDQVKAHSRRAESQLLAERDRVLAGERDQRDAWLDHLSTLRVSLSAANVALGSVPWAFPADKRPAAYDVLDEVYSTIEWNVPLGPGKGQPRPLPTQFQNNVLRLD